MKLPLLLRINKRSQDSNALKMAAVTLEKMTAGGIYDQLGGGFHRYSTDDKWLVPHFEKMLYDNALLASVYLEAFQMTNNISFRKTARDTLDYILRDMSYKDGGFYSAEDAGEVDSEGDFYVWTEDEIKKIVTESEFLKLKTIFEINPRGNFEGKIILNIPNTESLKEKNDPTIKSALSKLFLARSKRPRPHLDDKILTSWNALTISAMAKGYQVLGEIKYLDGAISSAKFIKKNLFREGKLLKRFRDNEAKHQATLDDYSYLIEALINLYQSTFEQEWLDWAVELQKTQDNLFWDNKAGGYFYSPPGDASIIIRQKELFDNATPSSQGVAILNLAKLYHFTFDKNFKDRTNQILSGISQFVNSHPAAFASSLMALDFLEGNPKEIVIVGPLDSKEAIAVLNFVRGKFNPNAVVIAGEGLAIEDVTGLAPLRGKVMLNGKTTFYICEEGSCKKPTPDAKEAMELIGEVKRYSWAGSKSER
jgi:uncharacterized protein YyaL (SSP411 family)